MSEPPLWAPWRMEYILGPKHEGPCVFCFDAAATPDELCDRLVVAETAQTIVMLNRYPFAAGHLLVLPRSHTSALDALEPTTCDVLFRVVRAACARLRDALGCPGLNVGLNLGAAAGAGIAEHLHVHIVPRWPGDTNFMPVVANVRVVPQALADTRAHLAPHFEGLGSLEDPPR